MREGRNIDIVMLYQTSGLNWMFFARRKTTNKSFTCFFFAIYSTTSSTQTDNYAQASAQAKAGKNFRHIKITN